MQKLNIDWEGLDTEIQSETGINEAEFSAMLENLSHLPKKSPGSEFVAQALEGFSIVPEKPRKLHKITWKHMLSVAVQRTRSAVIFGLLLYLTASFMIFSMSGSEMLAVTAASGIPFVFGMLYTLYQWRFGMFDLIKSCRLSLAKIITARIVMLFLVNLLANIFIAGFFTSIFAFKYEVFLRMILLWSTPFFLTVSACILLCFFVRSLNGMMVCMGLLPIITFALISIEPLQLRWLAQNTHLLAGEALFAMAALAFSFKIIGHITNRRVRYDISFE